MNSGDFDPQFMRLVAQFRLPPGADREALALEWYRGVESYSIADLERAVTALLRGAKDTFWPALGLLLDALRAESRRHESDQGDKCPTCHGSTWVNGWPYWHNDLVYQHVTRCPDCGVPAPQTHPTPYARPLTSVEAHDYAQGTLGRQIMPERLRAKTEAQPNADLVAAFERLRQKLFRGLT